MAFAVISGVRSVQLAAHAAARSGESSSASTTARRGRSISRVTIPATSGRELVVRERAEQAEEAEVRTIAAELERDAAARIAVAEERARIARELHDIVAYAVSVMVLQVGAVRHKLPDALAEERDALRGVERVASRRSGSPAPRPCPAEHSRRGRRRRPGGRARQPGPTAHNGPGADQHRTGRSWIDPGPSIHHDRASVTKGSSTPPKSAQPARRSCTNRPVLKCTLRAWT